MSEPLILTFDVGTQSVRAMLIDKTGCIRERTSHVYARPYYSLHPTWAEQRPDFYYEEMCLVSRELREKAPELFAQAVCMVMTVFRDSTVCLGRGWMPLRDCILWMDQRRGEPAPYPLAPADNVCPGGDDGYGEYAIPHFRVQLDCRERTGVVG